MNDTIIVVLKYTTLINERFEIFKQCIESLILSTEHINSCKTILVDNGDSEHEGDCLELYRTKKIHAYLRAPNIGMGHGRNAGLDIGLHLLPNAQFVVFVDDDIKFEKGWLEECVEILNMYPERHLIATPVHSRCHMRRVYHCGTLPDGRLLNKRAGSNCSFFRLKDYLSLGKFPMGRYNGADICGVKFTDSAIRGGFVSALTRTPLAVDMCPSVHGYSGRVGNILVNEVFRAERFHPLAGLKVGASWDETSTFLLYSFPDLILTCIDPPGIRKAPEKSQKYYPDRCKYISLKGKGSKVLASLLQEEGKIFDFVHLDDLTDTYSPEDEIGIWRPLIKSGGLLIGSSHAPFRKRKSYCQMLTDILGSYNTYGSYTWWKRI